MFPADRLAVSSGLGNASRVPASVTMARRASTHARGNAIVAERGGDDAAVDQFTGAHDRIVSARRSGAQNSRRFEQRSEIVELGADLHQNVVGNVGGKQPLNRVEVPAREFRDAIEHVRIATELGRGGQFEQSDR